MDPVVEELTAALGQVALQAPQLPYVSNVSGTWITNAEATDPSYWGRQLREPVQFAAGVAQLQEFGAGVFLEVGPGQTLGTLVRQQMDGAASVGVVSSLRHAQEETADGAFIARALGRLWLHGVTPDWVAYHAEERRHRVALPTYPFERQRYWIDGLSTGADSSPRTLAKTADVTRWFYAPAWTRTLPLSTHAIGSEDEGALLIFVDECGIGQEAASKWEDVGSESIRVTCGKAFACHGENSYTLDPRNPDDYQALAEHLESHGKEVQSVVHLWGVTPPSGGERKSELFGQHQDLGIYSVLRVVQTLGKTGSDRQLRLIVVTNNAQEVTGDEQLEPTKATVLGLCKVIPQEYPHIRCLTVDVTVPPQGDEWQAEAAARLMAEIRSGTSDVTIAHRGHHRWTQVFAPIPAGATAHSRPRLRESGVYLITGGLGRVGLALGEYLARSVKAKIVLVGRSEIPPRDEWEAWRRAHDSDDAVSAKIGGIQRLEAAGAEVLVVQADVAVEAEMRDVLSHAEDRFGVIHGVIHATGLTSGLTFTPIDQIGRAEFEEQFKPKIRGVMVLAGLLKNRPVDFCLLTSSLSAILGGIGFGAYAAANVFMDGFALSRSQRDSVEWLTVNWEGWRFDDEVRAGRSLVGGGSLPSSAAYAGVWAGAGFNLRYEGAVGSVGVA
jgi:acyl transferase domain-containing protein